MTSTVNTGPAAATPLRIRALALAGQMACLFSLAVVVTLQLLAIFSESWRNQLLSGGLSNNGEPAIAISDAMARALVLCSIPLFLCNGIALWIAYRLLSCFARGEVFARRPARLLAAIGMTVFVMSPVGILSKAVIVRLLNSASSSPSQGLSLQFTFADFDISLVAFGLLLIIVGKVMEEAARLSDENRQFV